MDDTEIRTTYDKNGGGEWSGKVGDCTSRLSIPTENLRDARYRSDRNCVYKGYARRMSSFQQSDGRALGGKAEERDGVSQ